jgi:hypothetical protein
MFYKHKRVSVSESTAIRPLIERYLGSKYRMREHKERIYQLSICINAQNLNTVSILCV